MASMGLITALPNHPAIHMNRVSPPRGEFATGSQGWRDDSGLVPGVGKYLMNAPTTILVIDDDPFARSALASHFSADPRFLVLATGRDGLEAIELAQEHSPDVIIMDIQMPRLDGVAATARIRKLQPQIRVLLLTVLHDDKEAREGIASGASGYLLKDASREVILEAVLVVHHKTAILPESLLGLIGSATRHAPEAAALNDELTPPRARCPNVALRRGIEQGDRRPPVHVRIDGQDPRLKDHDQAGGDLPHQGRGPRLSVRLRGRLISHKRGSNRLPHPTSPSHIGRPSDERHRISASTRATHTPAT